MALLPGNMLGSLVFLSKYSLRRRVLGLMRKESRKWM